MKWLGRVKKRRMKEIMMMKNNKKLAFYSEIYHRVELNPMEIYFIKQFFPDLFLYDNFYFL